MDRLSEIEERLANATPGPWVKDPDDPDKVLRSTNAGFDGTVIATMQRDDFGLVEEANTEFIAHARQDVPDLIAVVREVEALHRPHVVICLNPSHGKDCDGQVCDTCDNPWPCPTAAAVQKLGEGS
jgi:hypothetical protein